MSPRVSKTAISESKHQQWRKAPMGRHISILICVSILILALSACRTIGNDATPSPQPIGISNATATSDANDVPPSIPVEKFSISTSHQTMPEDVLREISHYSMGGSGDKLDCSLFCGREYQEPTIGWVPEEIELMENLQLCVCGLRLDELVHITLKLSDGQKISREVRVEQHYGSKVYFEFYYPTDLDDPPGSYIFILESDSGKVQHSVHVIKPIGPRLYCKDNNRLLLYNFEPDERIRLFSYEYNSVGYYKYDSVDLDIPNDIAGVFTAWQEYQVDSNGQLVIQVESGYMYAVIGDISGDVYPFGGTDFSDILSFDIEANTGSDHLNIREGPGYNYHVIAQVTSGTQIKVIGQPRRIDGDWWWPICLNDGTEGWVVDTWVKRVE